MVTRMPFKIVRRGCASSMANRGLPLAERFWQKVEKKDTGCWYWMAGRNGNSYGQIWDGQRVCLAHRVSWIMAYGSIPDGLYVCHHCDNPPCVNPAHLYLGTAKDNAHDRARRGRGGDSAGSKNGRAKITENQVREIRRRYATPNRPTPCALAREYLISQTTIYEILHGKTWAHVVEAAS